MRTDFVLISVLHRFVRQLQEGTLSATGVSEDHLAELENRTIPKGWWIRNILVQIPTDEIRELTADNPEPGIRRWSGVHITSGTNDQWVEGARNTHTETARLRHELRRWLEDLARKHRDAWIKEDYLEPAQEKFGDMVTENLLNEVWRAADLPPECKAHGRRT